MIKLVSAMCAVAGAAASTLAQFSFSVIAANLDHPTGIAVRGAGTVYFTEVPTPGVPGPMGGHNRVSVLNLGSGKIRTISMGEPEPLNIGLDKTGQPYWTCRTAGVILTVDRTGNRMPFLTGLSEPTGIDVGHDGLVYFTQIPTPGMPGSMGGMNTTNVSDGKVVMVLTLGEPEPYDIAVSRDGTTYWTCRSAGVILKRAPGGQVSLVMDNLLAPTGIALDELGAKLYFTDVPTPGMPGSMGGMNTVNVIDLTSGVRTVVHQGDPEPTDVAVAANGNIYWTCTSAGVIVEGRRIGGRR